MRDRRRHLTYSTNPVEEPEPGRFAMAVATLLSALACFDRKRLLWQGLIALSVVLAFKAWAL